MLLTAGLAKHFAAANPVLMFGIIQIQGNHTNRTLLRGRVRLPQLGVFLRIGVPDCGTCRRPRFILVPNCGGICLVLVAEL